MAETTAAEIVKVAETGATHTRWCHHKSRPAHPAEAKEQRTNIRWVMEEVKYSGSTHTRWRQNYDGTGDGRIRVSPESKPIRSRHDHRLRERVRLLLLGELRKSVSQETSLVKSAKAKLERGQQRKYEGHSDDRGEDFLHCGYDFGESYDYASDADFLSDGGFE